MRPMKRNYTINMPLKSSDKRVTVVLDDKLLHEAKVQAAKERITLRKLLNVSLADYLIRNKKRD